MRTPCNPETHFTGAADANTGGVGRITKRTPTAKVITLGGYATTNAGMLGPVFFGNGVFLWFARWSDTNVVRSTTGLSGSWTSVANVPDIFGVGVNAVRALYDEVNSVWVLSGMATTTNVVYRSTNNGDSWTAGGTLPSTGKWYIDHDGAGRVVAVNGTTTAYSTDGGQTWTTGGTLPTARIYTDNGATFYKGTWYVPGASGSTLDVSTDGGVSWSQRVVTDINQNRFLFATSTQLIANSHNDNVGSTVSLDGRNFNQYFLLAASFYCVVCPNYLFCVAAGLGRFRFHRGAMADEPLSSWVTSFGGGNGSKPIWFAYGNGRFVGFVNDTPSSWTSFDELITEYIES
jgi:hypothetical protein